MNSYQRFPRFSGASYRTRSILEIFGKYLPKIRCDARFDTPIYILHPLHFRISACWIVYGTGLEFSMCILGVVCVGNRLGRVPVPCAAQQGDPTSAGVNQGELRRRFTACERHDSGPPHCPTVSPPHRRKPRALCDRSPRSLRSSWRRSCESRQSVGRWYFSVAAYHSARAFFCQLSSQKSQALIGSGQGAWDL